MGFRNLSFFSFHIQNPLLLGITFIFFTIFSVTLSKAEIPEHGLLFYLSGDRDGDAFTADFARGETEPTFIRDVSIVDGGEQGSFFQCENTQLMAYQAPGNIYAERGTLAFFWRSRYPVGKVAFPIFRVAYADHSSWDYVWLRIDYNGNGFDAFVTDANLARSRISYAIPERPKPDKWIHITLSWDETKGVRFYINGELAAQKDTTAVFYAGLDQFGPHSRIISPYQVQSGGNFIRGGDIDEICIFDRMLSGDNIARLARGADPMSLDMEPFIRTLNDTITRNEWWLRYGWNRTGDVPPLLDAQSTKVRKVEIHDVYDLKQWWWKGTDGIRETTWPGVYNRSRIPGRTDYFILPDWNCYSLSGRSVTFFMPEEQWNHLEISGAAFGQFSLIRFDKETRKNTEYTLFDHPKDQERTFHRLVVPAIGGKIRFDNDVRETPIGEFQAYHVTRGREPEGKVKLTYTLTGKAEPDNPTLADLVSYINGRFLPDERSTMVALPGGAPRTPKKTVAAHPLPLVHILIPFEFRKSNYNRNYTRYSYTWENIDGGLDGIAFDIPPLDVKPTHGDCFPLNIQIKDPIWPDRNLFDFTFAVKPNEARTLWMDTRDRILPNDYSLYMTVAGASSDFSPASLEGARIRLVFKNRKEAAQEHEIDRFTQAKDTQAHMIEERPNIKVFRLYDRYSRDITDLLRVNPDHIPGRYYWSYKNPEQGWPAFKQPEPPPGVPLWAFRQVEYLKIYSDIILWWIDNRQIENGELGGGLSDDSDFTNVWPVPALMGVEPEKVTDSLHRELEAIYENGMFTDGLNTIFTDALHTTEEGVNVQAQLFLLEYGDPKLAERIMETALAFERVTGINRAGHRHFRSSYFSATEVADEDPWKWTTANTFRGLHPLVYFVYYNGHPRVKKLLLEMADGLTAHRRKDENGRYYTPGEINFETDEDRPSGFGA
ncbi:LamG-like jellyroll fold domain-containing protein, partial [Candidatus Latescibacterota bacterium]